MVKKLPAKYSKKASILCFQPWHGFITYDHNKRALKNSIWSFIQALQN
jgi:hypothetical protein